MIQLFLFSISDMQISVYGEDEELEDAAANGGGVESRLPPLSSLDYATANIGQQQQQQQQQHRPHIVTNGRRQSSNSNTSSNNDLENGSDTNGLVVGRNSSSSNINKWRDRQPTYPLPPSSQFPLGVSALRARGIWSLKTGFPTKISI